ncbi:MAG: hypothetical protein R2823_10130 [Acidimicrobiia bacterium]
MFCLACSMVGWPLCDECGRTLIRAPVRTVGSECSDGSVRVEVIPVYRHSGAAVRLVHQLKYRGSVGAGRLLARSMIEQLPPATGALVPIPRVFARRVVTGIDQTAMLASLIAEHSGIPVVSDLRAGVWSPRSAGRDRRRRTPGRFRWTGRELSSPLLVDDVCTTGTTLVAAAVAMGLQRAVGLVATSAIPRLASGTEPVFG